MDAQAVFDRAAQHKVPDFVGKTQNVFGRFASRVVERDDRFDKLVSDVRDELRNEMRKALAGQQQFVPSFTTDSLNRRKEKLQPTFDALMSALDYENVGEGFSAVLAHSQCPLVAALRNHLVSAYVAQIATGVAEARFEG